MHRLNHQFFSTISSMNSFSRSSRLNPHCPGRAGLWTGGEKKKHGVWFTVLPPQSLNRVGNIFSGITLQVMHLTRVRTSFSFRSQWWFDFAEKMRSMKIFEENRWPKIFWDSAPALLLLLLLISNTALLSSQLTLFTVTLSPSALCHCSTASPPLPRLCSATLTLCRKV